MEHEFTIGGRKMRLDDAQVTRKLQGIQPEPARTLVVEINGTLYPVKQAFAQASGMDRADFISHQARRVFQQLGFPVKRLT